MTHICVSKLTIIGSDNGLSPDRCQAIIWTNPGILLIGHLGTNFSEISIEILTFSFKKMRLKVSSAKRWPFCLGLNVLIIMPQWVLFSGPVSLAKQCRLVSLRDHSFYILSDIGWPYSNSNSLLYQHTHIHLSLFHLTQYPPLSSRTCPEIVQNLIDHSL